MTIQVNFESFDEMMGFARRLAGGGPVEAAAAGPAATKPTTVKAVVAKPETAGEAPAAAPGDCTMEDVRKKLLELNKAGKKEKVAELIKGFGVDKFPQVPPEKYGELMAKAEAL